MGNVLIMLIYITYQSENEIFLTSKFFGKSSPDLIGYKPAFKHLSKWSFSTLVTFVDSFSRIIYYSLLLGNWQPFICFALLVKKYKSKLGNRGEL